MFETEDNFDRAFSTIHLLFSNISQIFNGNLENKFNLYTFLLQLSTVTFKTKNKNFLLYFPEFLCASSLTNA